MYTFLKFNILNQMHNSHHPCKQTAGIISILNFLDLKIPQEVTKGLNDRPIMNYDGQQEFSMKHNLEFAFLLPPI